MNLHVRFSLCALGILNVIIRGSQGLDGLYIDKQSVSETKVGEVLFEREAVSAVDCAAMCKGTVDCMSTVTAFVHSPSTLTCYGYGQLAPGTGAAAASSVLDPGAVAWVQVTERWLALECISDAQCPQPNSECFSGQCLCSPGFFYSIGRDSCSATCPQEDLQTAMLVYAESIMIGYNINCHWGISRDECLQLCVETPEALTCDYDLKEAINTSFCCLQAFTRLTIPDNNWGTSATTTHYQKQCA